MVTNFVVRNMLFSEIGYLLEIYKIIQYLLLFPGDAVVRVTLNLRQQLDSENGTKLFFNIYFFQYIFFTNIIFV